MTSRAWGDLAVDRHTREVDLSRLLDGRIPVAHAHRVDEHHTRLGEHPVALPNGRIIWVDIDAGEVRQWSPDPGLRTVLLRLPPPVSLAIPDPQADSLLVLSGEGLSRLWLDGSNPLRTLGLQAEAQQPGLRFNDGAVAPDGTLWLGLMETDDDDGDPLGSLLSIGLGDDAPTARTELHAMSCPNGIGWRFHDTQLLVVESSTRSVAAAQVDPATGRPRNWRIACRFLGTQAYPDGLLCEGDRVWIAFWDLGVAVRFDPDFVPQLIVSLPDPRVTSMCWGADGLLYVTAASGLFATDPAGQLGARP